ncbi:hypothetical protein [Nocardia sp. MH4]|uniref:hypothetical protein n=1 Tax=Nocardia sp. MH4 TaxID=1768677 RepID=UPI00210669F5|nr:hypothetical protein [Nocardia sp. MH4]
MEIAGTHGITPEDFTVLDGMEPVTDKDGKTYFIMPSGTSGDDAQKAVLMTYILNAGTDYDKAGLVPGVVNDFEETPYSSAEVQRIIDRQDKNDWSYDQDVAFIDSNGGRLATTPNGMLMGLGGNELQDLYSQKGGTTYGDIFMMNLDDLDDPASCARSPNPEVSGSTTGADHSRVRPIWIACCTTRNGTPSSGRRRDTQA